MYVMNLHVSLLCMNDCLRVYWVKSGVPHEKERTFKWSALKHGSNVLLLHDDLLYVRILEIGRAHV